MAGFAGFYHSLTCFPSSSMLAARSCVISASEGDSSAGFQYSCTDTYTTVLSLIHRALSLCCSPSCSPTPHSSSRRYLRGCTVRLLWEGNFLARLRGKAQSAGVARSLTRSEPLKHPYINPAYWELVIGFRTLAVWGSLPC